MNRLIDDNYNNINLNNEQVFYQQPTSAKKTREIIQKLKQEKESSPPQVI